MLTSTHSPVHNIKTFQKAEENTARRQVSRLVVCDAAFKTMSSGIMIKHRPAANYGHRFARVGPASRRFATASCVAGRRKANTLNHTNRYITDVKHTL